MTQDVLAERRILLGVSGGIAAYKAPALIRELQRLGAEVRAVMTQSACEFVRPLTLQVLTGAPVGTDLFDLRYEEQIGHIELARWADVVLVAPATAHLIGRYANGLADDLLTTVLLATTAPVVLAPSMNTQMLQNPAVQANLTRVRELQRGHVVDPDSGDLACREVGPGRMPDPEVLVDALLTALSPKPLAGLRVLVTLGPTRERIDAVRFLTNASSGRMGLAMARAARHLGASVVVVAGPIELTIPPDIAHRAVESARQMAAAVDAEVDDGVDIAVFTAAVADIRPVETSREKTPKAELSSALPLARTPDVLARVAARREKRPFCVGFAAETGEVAQKAMEKCQRKACDLVVGNDVSGGSAFGSHENQVWLVDREASLAQVGPASKLAVARQLWAHIVERFERRK